MFPPISDLKRLRLKSGLSQKDLATMAYVSQSAIAKYENGTQVPSYEIAVKIFESLLGSDQINEPTLSEVMHHNIVFLNPKDHLEHAISVMKNNSFSQVPVKNRNGRIVGTINESGLLDLLSQYHDLSQFKQERVSTIMDEPMPLVAGSSKISEVSGLLKRFGGILVVENGEITGIVTKADLIYV